MSIGDSNGPRHTDSLISHSASGLYFPHERPDTYNPPVFVVGDVHGQHERLVTLLIGTGLIDGDLSWSGADAALWFLGDFFDRGPDGIGAVELVMRLQREAPRSGGRVNSLLGNHEPLLLAAKRFGTAPGLSSGPGGTFVSDWERNGGVARDLERLTPEIEDWLTSLPALALVSHALLVHADALFYHDYGASIAEVNQNIRAVLCGTDPAVWDRLLGQFSERDALHGPDGEHKAREFLKAFGAGIATGIVHGHTPISRHSGQQPEEVTSALVYADGLCVNVDGGMYLGGPGFVYEIKARDSSAETITSSSL